MFKTYNDLLEIYRMGIIELHEITYEDAFIDCANLIVELDRAHERGDVSDQKYLKARKDYEKAYAVLGNKIIEGTFLLKGYRIADNRHIIKNDGSEVAPLDCDRYHQLIVNAKTFNQ